MLNEGVFRRLCLCFFFNDTATTEIYTLSLHDALPISGQADRLLRSPGGPRVASADREGRDRKSTRLNSSHDDISYAVFCLKEKDSQNLWMKQSRVSFMPSCTEIRLLHAKRLQICFFFNDAGTTEIYLFPLTDALRF